MGSAVEVETLAGLILVVQEEVRVVKAMQEAVQLFLLVAVLKTPVPAAAKPGLGPFLDRAEEALALPSVAAMPVEAAEVARSLCPYWVRAASRTFLACVGAARR